MSVSICHGASCSWAFLHCIVRFFHYYCSYKAAFIIVRISGLAILISADTPINQDSCFLSLFFVILSCLEITSWMPVCSYLGYLYVCAIFNSDELLLMQQPVGPLWYTCFGPWNQQAFFFRLYCRCSFWRKVPTCQARVTCITRKTTWKSRTPPCLLWATELRT